jgi:lysophospholipase L1-like esterase
MIVTLGDSICWGQGLLDVHKFDRIFAAGASLTRVAHSGAILGSEGDNSTVTAYPEVPVSYPSVWQQLGLVADWTDVDWAIVNGGLNDVSLTRILSPWVSTTLIEQLAQQFCGAEMTRFLTSAVGRLVKPTARIAVLGYYPILSEQTKFDDAKKAQMLMESHGVATGSGALGKQPDPAALVPAIVANCLAFWKASDTALAAAVHAVNTQVGREVCVFVASPFTEANAAWAPDSWVWELSDVLDAQDEVKDLRDMACDKLYGDVVDLLTWIKCDRASVGHPDVEGAAQIAAALVAASLTAAQG